MINYLIVQVFGKLLNLGGIISQSLLFISLIFMSVCHHNIQLRHDNAKGHQSILYFNEYNLQTQFIIITPLVNTLPQLCTHYYIP